MSTDRPPLHVEGILRALDAHDVRYIVIGGVAGRAHGDPTLTYDLDITPDPAADNLTRLAGALNDMQVGVRVPDLDEPIPFEFDARFIARFSTMATRGALGDLDVVLRPDGIPGGYEQLAANALREPAYGLTIAIADLDDLIATRRAAAAITGLDHYTDAADRLADLQSRRQPRPSHDADAQRDTHRACFPQPPEDAIRSQSESPPVTHERETPSQQDQDRER